MHTTLNQDFKDANGNILYTLSTVLNGDGKTPVVQTVGSTAPVGFNDDGSPIMPQVDEEKLLTDQQSFMSRAITVQKVLSQSNGIDPSLVNMIGAENDSKNNT